MLSSAFITHECNGLHKLNFSALCGGVALQTQPPAHSGTCDARMPSVCLKSDLKK